MVRRVSATGPGVPWVAFLDRRVTTSTQSGVYPVLLFKEDMSGFYLTVAQGTQQLKKQGRQFMLDQLSLAATRVRELITPDLIDAWVRGEQRHSIGLRQSRPRLRSEHHRSQVLRARQRSRRLLNSCRTSTPPSTSRMRTSSAAATLLTQHVGIESCPRWWRHSASSVDASGLLVPGGHGDRVISFISALVTKPFVILSGMSGSGKTQLALRLGEYFGAGPHGRRALAVSVRPDWTGPEALFGYEDALRPAVDGQAAWFVPDTLAFMLAAAEEPDMPYLLLLDEMNLAHVERYFSDFLSGVESRDAILPNLAMGDDGEWRVASTTEPRMPIPRNVVRRRNCQRG